MSSDDRGLKKQAHHGGFIPMAREDAQPAHIAGFAKSI
jgi:hypothetical protein